MSSSDDDTTFAGKQVAQILQSHFDCRADDIAPISGMPIASSTRSRHFVETISALSYSCTGSAGGSS